MKIRLLYFLCVLAATNVFSQEPSIFTRNFRGVKSVKYYTSSTDTTGKLLEKRKLTEQHFYDSSGRETRILRYVKDEVSSSDDFVYDSLGRKTMYIAWTKKEGNKKYIFTYETKGQFTIVREYHNKEVVRTESNYWDTLSNRYIERAWYGESTWGAPPYQHEYNREGKLVNKDSYNGFTEYRYDSLGTLNYMLIRQFEDGHCSAYMPFEYTAVYANGRLCKFISRWSISTFTYNERGFIASETIRPSNENRITATEAEYVYYIK